MPHLKVVKIIQDSFTLEICDNQWVNTYILRLLNQVIKLIQSLYLANTVQHSFSLVIFYVER